uniref:Uncharacterized protein TCIL3000_11_8640 n=1 Tax=Trypanosoma congolense (strain IL3000) TaxID=1068625 RepID=G0V190_TRYCI|nr:unnamed protein product [Trypanosoma congolense IL3000]
MSNVTVDSGHTSKITDAAVDASGKLLASSGEDGTIRVFSTECPIPGESNTNGGASWRLLITLTGHKGPVVSIAWAPAQYYTSALLSCGEDGQVILWGDVGQNPQEWLKIYTTTLSSPPWCTEWAPPAHGKMFAVGCKSGAVVVFTGEGQQWSRAEFNAHPSGCFSLSWGPSMPPGALFTLPLEGDPNAQQQSGTLIAPPRIVTCGGEGRVTVWTRNCEGWHPQELPLDVDASWREVAWAPGVGTRHTYIAAGSEEGFVVVWSQEGDVTGEWTRVLLPQQEDGVTKLSWSPVGTFLLVSCANGTASMWQESTSGQGWERSCELFES